MNLLITGGSGLIGRYVVDELSAAYDVEVVDLRAPHRSDIPWHKVDVLDLPTLRRITAHASAVVHLAGIPHPFEEPSEKVFSVNAVGTFTALEACSGTSVKRFILISSESTLGFAFSTIRIWPEYLPIDESHPLRAHDPYGLSKQTAELLCSAYSRKAGIQTVCLRPPWVWVPEKQEIALYRQLVAEYSKWWKNLWAYIHVKDLARCIRLALEASVASNHEAMFVCADDQWTGKETRELVREFFPETQHIDALLEGDASLISNAKARRILGFRPQYAWKDILG